MRRRGLGWQLALAFALVAVATALIAGVVLSNIWQRQFETYVRENLQQSASQYAHSYAGLYAMYGGWPTVGPVYPPGGNSAGIRIEVFDVANRRLADNADAIEKLTGRTVADVAPASAVAAHAPIVVGGRTVGHVTVWADAPGGLLSNRDVQFRDASTNGLFLAAILAVVFASGAGVLYARRFSRPINQVTATAAALSAGELEARTNLTGDDPVGVLGRTLDEMADSIEADRQFERRLTADVAHELRTPLQAIQATVEAMQDGVLPADEKHLETVRNETVRLARLADSILELARLERGAAAVRREPVDPAAPLLSALDIHRALIESAGLTLVEDVSPGLVVQGDADRLSQAFGNLLANAARYTPSGGTVTVGLTAEGGEAAISIADTGIGIAEEDIDRVFVRFWRADEARSRATGGLGIGLAVVKEIVDRHGGRLDVASKPGEGTTFTVRLPLVREETAPAAPRVRVPGFRRAV